MNEARQARDEVFAVIRFDPNAAGPHDQVRVEEVVRTRQTADAEVRRLSDLDAASGCHYFAQQTRLLTFDESGGPGG